MDTDWIQQEQKLHNIHQKCLPEPLYYLSIVHLYINKQSHLVDTVKHEIQIKKSISKEEIITLVHKHKRETQVSQFILKDTLLFHIPVEPEDLSKFLQKSFDCNVFLKSFPIIENIDLPNSIFIFHQANTLFFVYYEEDKPSVKKLKSALKTDKTRATKRVRIKVPRHTRKQI
jgi:hypothetical protein